MYVSMLVCFIKNTAYLNKFKWYGEYRWLLVFEVESIHYTRTLPKFVSLSFSLYQSFSQ